MTVLVPVRYPPNDANRRAIAKARDLLATDPNPELVIVHVNRLQREERVDRNDLREAIETEFGALPAHYVVRDSFLYEETVLNEATRHGAAHIVLSERRYGAWQRLVRDLLDRSEDLEAFLTDHLDAEIHIVPDST